MAKPNPIGKLINWDLQGLFLWNWEKGTFFFYPKLKKKKKLPILTILVLNLQKNLHRIVLPANNSNKKFQNDVSESNFPWLHESKNARADIYS